MDPPNTCLSQIARAKAGINWIVPVSVFYICLCLYFIFDSACVCISDDTINPVAAPGEGKTAAAGFSFSTVFKPALHHFALQCSSVAHCSAVLQCFTLQCSSVLVLQCCNAAVHRVHPLLLLSLHRCTIPSCCCIYRISEEAASPPAHSCITTMPASQCPDPLLQKAKLPARFFPPAQLMKRFAVPPLC